MEPSEDNEEEPSLAEEDVNAKEESCRSQPPASNGNEVSWPVYTYLGGSVFCTGI